MIHTKVPYPGALSEPFPEYFAFPVLKPAKARFVSPAAGHKKPFIKPDGPGKSPKNRSFGIFPSHGEKRIKIPRLTLIVYTTGDFLRKTTETQRGFPKFFHLKTVSKLLF
jgi:hypothetical protein